MHVMRRLIEDLKAYSILRRCPFCNGLAEAGSNDAISYCVRCLSCGCRSAAFHLPGVIDDSDERTMGDIQSDLMNKAIESWNRRV